MEDNAKITIGHVTIVGCFMERWPICNRVKFDRYGSIFAIFQAGATRLFQKLLRFGIAREPGEPRVAQGLTGVPSFLRSWVQL